ncbi:MAG TPA: PHP domain-containing protein [Tissierellaceae bacterium]
MQKFDLHLHTTHSDGELSPEELIDIAFDLGLSGVAITDHDCVSAIEIAKNHILDKNYNNFELIPGIEFGTTYNHDEIHILGYFIDYKNKDLLEMIDKLNTWRFERTYKIIDKLNKVGIEIYPEDIIDENSNFTGRVDIAKEMLKKGYVTSISEAFEKYIGIGNSCYVEKNTLTVEEIINVIKNAGGVSVLAHPILIKNYKSFEHVINSGIDGIEYIHSKQSITDSITLKNYALNKELILTGGSDCHGRTHVKDGELLLGKYYIYSNELDKLRGISNGRK